MNKHLAGVHKKKKKKKKKRAQTIGTFCTRELQ